MEVQYAKNLVLRTEVYDPIEVFESTLLQHPRVHIILEVPVVERDSDTIKFQAGEVLDILFAEVILQPLVKEEVRLLLAKHFGHRPPVLKFMTWIASDEVLHAILVSLTDIQR